MESLSLSGAPMSTLSIRALLASSVTGWSAPLLTSRRAVDLCRVDSCLCRTR
jgi:hypothetical protein